jgi:hypothetical protein
MSLSTRGFLVMRSLVGIDCRLGYRAMELGSSHLRRHRYSFNTSIADRRGALVIKRCRTGWVRPPGAAATSSPGRSLRRPTRFTPAQASDQVVRSVRPVNGRADQVDRSVFGVDRVVGRTMAGSNAISSAPAC